MADDPENTLIMQLEGGPVTIKLRPDLAPGHVARIKELAREGFYDGIVFHRVIPGFMAQGGDPKGVGVGGSSKPNLKAGDRFVRSVGREIALMHAIADAASAFKVAAQVAYDSRAHAVKEVA